MNKILTQEQVEFIELETNIKFSTATLEGLSSESLDKIFDTCFEIEVDEAEFFEKTGKLSKRGEMAVSIGDIFAQRN